MPIAMRRLPRLIALETRRVASELRHGPGSHATFTLGGVELELGPWATALIRAQIYEGRYEVPERTIIERTLRAEDVVLEIGAGMGYISTLAAGIARELRTFDANPELARVAAATVQRNGRRAEVQNAVLLRSPSSETIPFYLSEHFPNSSLSPIYGAPTVDVPVVDFSQACAGCTYLIVDIEGAEVDLLRGELPGIRSICVECHPKSVTPAQLTRMLTALFEQGFALDLDISQGQVLYLERGGEAAG